VIATHINVFDKNICTEVDHRRFNESERASHLIKIKLA
jgi:hypothetical protein